MKKEEEQEVFYEEFFYRKFRRFEHRFSASYKIEKNIIKTGIRVLDEPIGGIISSDFFVIGAATGIGKTHICSNIAQNIALSGKKVVLFSLESFEGEIEERAKFHKMSKEFYYQNNFKPMRYRNMKLGEYENTNIREIENEVIKNTSFKLKKNLFIRYRDDSEYSIKNFETEINIAASIQEISCIIIDHLHYFSFPDKESENRAIKNIINKLRDIGLLLNIPIILMAHLRKKDRGNKSVVPMIEEFHGSSEITKNPTCVVTIAPAYDIIAPSKTKFPTYFHIGKNRYDGSLKKYVFSTLFDIVSGKYEEEYKIYNCFSNGEKLERVDSDFIPDWAKTITF
jgi:replicative DNA helicase